VPAPSPAPVAPAVAPPAKPKAKPKSGRKGLWMVIAIVVLGSGGGWWWWQNAQAASAHAAKKAPVAEARPQARYYALEPAFVVNLTDEESVRYLQADLQLMTRDETTLAAFEAHAPAIRNRLLLLFGQQSAAQLAQRFEAHAPAIRNRLLLLFGQQSAAQLAQRSGKERLQEAALAEVRKLLKDEGAADRVEAAIFTSLVTQ